MSSKQPQINSHHYTTKSPPYKSSSPVRNCQDPVRWSAGRAHRVDSQCRVRLPNKRPRGSCSSIRGCLVSSGPCRYRWCCYRGSLDARGEPSCGRDSRHRYAPCRRWDLPRGSSRRTPPRCRGGGWWGRLGRARLPSRCLGRRILGWGLLGGFG